jgi:hypothetical protein
LENVASRCYFAVKILSLLTRLRENEDVGGDAHIVVLIEASVSPYFEHCCPSISADQVMFALSAAYLAHRSLPNIGVAGCMGDETARVVLRRLGMRARSSSK